MGFTLLGILSSAGAGGIPEVFWLNWQESDTGTAPSGTLSSNNIRQLDADADGNILLSFSGFQQYYAMHKFTRFLPDGNVDIFRYVNSNNTSPDYEGVAALPDGSFVIGARAQWSGSNGLHQWLTKYNAAGTFQAYKTVQVGNNTNLAAKVRADSTKVYTRGYRTGPISYNPVLSVYDHSLNWEQGIYASTNYNGQEDIQIDSSGNYYLFCGRKDTFSGATYRPVVAKISAANVLQWQRALLDNNNARFTAGSVDSSGNVYAAGFSNQTGTGTTYDAILTKWDSNGTLQWQRAMTATGSAEFAGLKLGDDGNIYAIGTYRNGSSQDIGLLACYSSSGVLQWQRFFRRSDYQPTYGKDVTFYGSAVIAGFNVQRPSNDWQWPMIARLPADGSLTSTYTIDGVDVVYENGTMTDFNPALVSTAESLTFTTTTATTRTPSDVSNGSYTDVVNLLEIG